MAGDARERAVVEAEIVGNGYLRQGRTRAHVAFRFRERISGADLVSSGEAVLGFGLQRIVFRRPLRADHVSAGGPPIQGIQHFTGITGAAARAARLVPPRLFASIREMLSPSGGIPQPVKEAPLPGESGTGN